MILPFIVPYADIVQLYYHMKFQGGYVHERKITVLAVGRKCAEVIKSMLASGTLDVDFALVSRESYVVEQDDLADIPSRFHVTGVCGCEQIVRDKFSDTDMLFIISAIEDMSFASEIAQAARVIGILTIGIVLVNYDFSGIILTAEVPNLYEFARWVMSGAPHIRVIEPDELKDIVKEFADSILRESVLC